MRVEDTSKVEGSGGPVHPLKTPDDISPDPLKLPTGFEWVSIDVTQDDQIDEIYTLLYQNYVEDDDNMFRFDYSIEFLRWALCPPGQYEDWVVGLRTIKKKKMVACITGIPLHMFVDKKKVKMTCGNGMDPRWMKTLAAKTGDAEWRTTCRRGTR